MHSQQRIHNSIHTNVKCTQKLSDNKNTYYSILQKKNYIFLNCSIKSLYVEDATHSLFNEFQTDIVWGKKENL